HKMGQNNQPNHSITHNNTNQRCSELTVDMALSYWLHPYQQMLMLGLLGQNDGVRRRVKHLHKLGLRTVPLHYRYVPQDADTKCLVSASGCPQT
ncbi:hypothetical protein, partial [Ruegeria atlantica]|uniref:hypothetical protein n=1 Tax=Ruegeria atlantica TaxID=81569 RepID=UPI00249584C5